MYMGIDVHKKFSQVCLMTEKGDVVDEQKLINFTEEFDKYLRKVSKHRVRAALEATGIVMPIIKELEKNGIETNVAHPSKTKLIAESKHKTDKVDAKILANLLRTDFLPRSYLPPEPIRQLREIVRDRTRLVQVRSKMKTQIRHILLHRGIVTEENVFTQAGRTYLQELRVDSISRRLELIEHLDKLVDDLDNEIKSKAQHDEKASAAATMPGIGYFTALLVVAEIGDVNRFLSSKKLCSYAGLVPSIRQSGDVVRTGHITKQGSKLIRWAMIQCAHIAISQDTRFRSLYMRMERRHKSVGKRDKKAVVAVARHMLSILYWMLRHNNTYEEEIMLMKEKSSHQS